MYVFAIVFRRDCSYVKIYSSKEFPHLWLADSLAILTNGRPPLGPLVMSFSNNRNHFSRTGRALPESYILATLLQEEQQCILLFSPKKLKIKRCQRELYVVRRVLWPKEYRWVFGSVYFKRNTCERRCNKVVYGKFTYVMKALVGELGFTARQIWHKMSAVCLSS